MNVRAAVPTILIRRVINLSKATKPATIHNRLLQPRFFSSSPIGNMRALRYHGPRDLRVEYDVPEPVCLPHQVKVRPAFCGICGTDLHEYSSPTFIPTKDKPHPVTGESMPITIGHEFSGEVVEVGSEVTGALKVGDRVAVQPTVCCHQCAPCKEGHVNCCDHAGFGGVSGGGGGMSDFVCVDSNFVFQLPDNIPLDVGGMYNPFARTIPAGSPFS
jgi:threonine dehydrogenase-like Zn-dependent dehydrogenase